MKTILLFTRFITLFKIWPFKSILFNKLFTEYCPILSQFWAIKFYKLQ